MSYTVLIPARLSSSRLPGKPLADIGGLPMVVRVAQRAAKAALRAAWSQVMTKASSPPALDTASKPS